jgi:hypothetical protein
VEARFSAPVQTGPWTYPPSYTMYTVSFPGGGLKRPGRGFDHPPPSSAKVKERVELYFSPSGPSWSVMGRNLPFCLLCSCRLSAVALRCGRQGEITTLGSQSNNQIIVMKPSVTKFSGVTNVEIF